MHFAVTGDLRGTRGILLSLPARNLSQLRGSLAHGLYNFANTVSTILQTRVVEKVKVCAAACVMLKKKKGKEIDDRSVAMVL